MDEYKLEKVFNVCKTGYFYKVLPKKGGVQKLKFNIKVNVTGKGKVKGKGTV